MQGLGQEGARGRKFGSPYLGVQGVGTGRGARQEVRVALPGCAGGWDRTGRAAGSSGRLTWVCRGLGQDGARGRKKKIEKTEKSTNSNCHHLHEVVTAHE